MTEQPKTPETEEEIEMHGRHVDDCQLMEGDEADYVRAGFARRLERERDALRAALRELVRLKDLHDRLEEWPRSVYAGYPEACEEYKTKKPLAWARARALLDKEAK